MRILSALGLAVVALAAAQNRFDQTYDSLVATQGIHEVAVSPDGKRVAWAQHGTGIFTSDVAVAKPTRLASGEAIDWSPDGRRIAFLADPESAGQQALFTIDAGGGQPKKLTDVKGYMAEPRWSPDGTKIAFLFTENAVRVAGPMAPVTPESGVVGQKIYYQRIAVVDTKGGTVRQVSPPDLYVYEYDWSPDGSTFAATAAPGPGDNNWYIAKLYTFEAGTGKANTVYKPDFQIADPRWSPDGKSIAFVGGLMSDEGSTGGDVFVIAASGGEPRNVTPGMSASASGVKWLSDGRIFVPEGLEGESAFAVVDPATGKLEQLWRGQENTSRNGWRTGASLSRDGKTWAVIRHSFAVPPEVWAGAPGSWRQISSVNSKMHPEWGEAKSIRWMVEGRSVQGWLLYPYGYSPDKKWPLVVWVHGGPAVMEKSSWPAASTAGLLAASGYFVLFPNPRGSFGGGEEFTRANVRDFGYGDFRDILDGVDEAVRTLPVDNNRIGITGWSYGGNMSMWAVTQTRRFRAAVSGAGLANWQSYYGQNQIDQWLLPYFGASVYDDPAVYARSSPITFIKNVKTPTLIVVGDRDAECPAPQSWEFWHALKTLGVETEFVIYPNEGHAFGDSAHQRDVVRRTVEWFDQHLK